MQSTITGTVDSSNTITLPTDCRAVESLRLSTGGTYTEIHPLPPERLADTLTTAFPVGYVTVGSVLTLIGGNGTPDYALTYFQSIPALSASQTTNWLLLREPALYLYGALIEASPYIGDDNRAATWATQYTVTAKGMQVEDASARYGNAPAIGCPIRNCP